MEVVDNRLRVAYTLLIQIWRTEKLSRLYTTLLARRDVKRHVFHTLERGVGTLVVLSDDTRFDPVRKLTEVVA